MATHAAMVENIDKNVERVVSFLKTNNLYTDTVIFFLSDNGASNEGGSGGLSTATRLRTVGATWANTPWRLYKKFVREGGIATPLIVRWPAGITQPAIRWQPGHLIDLMPTILELTGATYPAKFHGNPILPLEGRSLVPAFNSTNIVPRTLFFEHEGNRAIRSNDWKLVSIGRNTLEWELFNLASERSETTNLAAANPGVVASLSNAWEAMAWRVKDLPSPDVNNYVKMRSWITVDDALGGDGDGQPEPGDTVNLTIQTIKRGSGPDTGLTGTLSCADPCVSVLTSNAPFGDFSSGKASGLTPFRVQISSNAPVNQGVLFSIRLDLGGVEQWADIFALVVHSFAKVSGRVIEAGSGEALRNATLAGGMVGRATSDAFGNYELLLETGPYDLTAALSGYAPTQRVALLLADAADEDFSLVWTNVGLNLRFDRPYPPEVVIPTNVNLILRSTVHNGPQPGNGPIPVAWSASGPAGAVFEDAAAEDTAVRLPQSGAYVLQATADNGWTGVTQSVRVIVTGAGSVEPSTNALVLQFKLDEAAGLGAAADSSRNAHTGTLPNMSTATAWTTGVYSGALRFDGVDDILAVNSSVLLNNQVTTQRAVSLWFRADDPSLSSKQTLYKEGGCTRGLNIYLAGGQLYVGGWNRDPAQSDWNGNWIAAAAPPVGTWHHVTVVLNGGSAVQPDSLFAYLDEVEVGRSPGAQLHSRGDAIGLGATYDATRFHDGTTIGQTNGAYFAGVIDEARIYNRLLTVVEIAALANASPYSRVIAVNTGPDQPLHSGLAVPLVPQLELLGPAPYPWLAGWTVKHAPFGGSVLFSQPNINGIPTLATVNQAGAFTFRLTADAGDVASYADVGVSAIRSFSEWIGGFASLAPAERLPSADPDLDFGHNNVEYELGTPPDCGSCSNPAMRAAITVSDNPGSNVRVRVFLRRGALERGLGLMVQRRTDLVSGNWAACPFTVGSIEDTTDFEFQGLTLELQLTPAELAEQVNYFRATFTSGS